VTEDLLRQLQFFFPDNLILAALDLIDRECVIRYISPISRTHLQVIGSTTRYNVKLDLPLGSQHSSKFWCSCPAFTFSVLLSETHFMCKHVLASRLAENMDRVVVRKVGFEEWADLVSRHDSM